MRELTGRELDAVGGGFVQFQQLLNNIRHTKLGGTRGAWWVKCYPNRTTKQLLEPKRPLFLLNYLSRWRTQCAPDYFVDRTDI